MSSPSRPEPTPGLVVVDKAGQMTSHDVVSRVRRIAGTRKVGHAGTLDPMATGVLVLGVGRATRLLGHLVLAEKSYDATLRLGASTTTDDAEGELLTSADPVELAALSEQDVREALADQVGERDQVPSSVSAVKVDGRRAYARVRAGEEVELAPRRVTIHELQVHGLDPTTSDLTGLAALDVRISVRCSSGTYIRAIARDVGAALGVGGHLSALRRTAVGPFTLEQAATLEALGEQYAVLPIAEAARLVLPHLSLDPEQARAASHGRPLSLALDGVTALLDPDGALLGLYEPRDGLAKPVAVLV